ncbi:MAG: Mov34/MPN/PAD-1 family protein [Burkholderiales bacterium]|nr:Mov34/MPN/PAD-1 family protein [Burkholderiales bacterium]
MKFCHKTWNVLLTENCVSELMRHRQSSGSSRENGGQLFARFVQDGVQVEVATVTRGFSRRTRFGFWPDRKAEQADINQLFERGLHYIGDWHTHPEEVPSPSATDEQKMQEIFRKSRHELPFMLMVIVGQAVFPRGLFLGVVQATGIQSLDPC